MNDLFSAGSFKRYTDLNDQVRMDDVEMGGMAGEEGGGDLDKFFHEVGSVKEDVAAVERLLRQLQEANEESKTHNARTVKALRSRMDADVEQVLRLSKLIKTKLQALDQSNAANRKLPGCGPGSSADRTRTSVVVGLGRKLKDITNEFQALRGKISAEYKETVERRYFTITGERADEQTIEHLIASGESETFVQKAIREQGRGQVLDTISEIQERHDAVKEMEKNLLDLHQVFLDMAALVEAQGQQLNDIESNVAHANSFVRRGTDQLQTAREYQKSSRKWTCIGIGIGLVVVCLILVPIAPSLLKHTMS